jgi:hypothetical protein
MMKSVATSLHKLPPPIKIVKEEKREKKRAQGEVELRSRSHARHRRGTPDAFHDKSAPNFSFLSSREDSLLFSQ